MSYYWFNRQELLKKAKEKYDHNGSKEKVAKYYLGNKVVIKEKEKKINIGFCHTKKKK